MNGFIPKQFLETEKGVLREEKIKFEEREEMMVKDIEQKRVYKCKI